MSEVVYGTDCIGVVASGGSEKGGSEPMLGLSGVRKGDLNGFFKVFVASFTLRRLACGVDILACAAALRGLAVNKVNETQRGGVILVRLSTTV